MYSNELNLIMTCKNHAEFKMPSYKENMIWIQMVSTNRQVEHQLYLTTFVQYSDIFWRVFNYFGVIAG